MLTKSHKAKTILGLKWSLVNQIFTQSTTFIIGIILARLLSPKEFGLIGMVTVITGFANVINNFGVGSALVQKKNITDDDLSSVFWLNIIISLVLTALVCLAAQPISIFYDIKVLENITYFLSIPFALSGFGMVQRSLMVRSMDFKRQFFIDFSSNFVSGTIAVILAFSGWGVWSLVVKSILGSFLNVILLWITSKWTPNYKWRRKNLQEIFNFSIPLLGTNALNYWTRNLDNLLIGKYIGSVGLGYYSRAYTFMLLPVNQISGVISKVLFPSFSEIQDDPVKIKSIYLKITRIIAFFTFPLMFGLSVSAEPFVRVLLGDKWNGVIPILRILAILGAFQSIGTLNGNIFLARDATRLQLKVGLVVKFIVISSIVVGLQYGTLGVAYAISISSILLSLPLYSIMGKLINLNVKEVILNLKAPFLISLIMALLISISNSLILNDMENIYCLLINIFFGGMLYLILNIIFKTKSSMEVLNLIKGNI